MDLLTSGSGHCLPNLTPLTGSQPSLPVEVPRDFFPTLSPGWGRADKQASYILLTTEQNGLRAAAPIYFYPLEDTQIHFLFLKASLKMQTNPPPWTFVSCSLWP